MAADLDVSRHDEHIVRIFQDDDTDPQFQPRTVVSGLRSRSFHVRVARRPHASGLTLVLAGHGRWSAGSATAELGPGSCYVSAIGSPLDCAVSGDEPMRFRQVTVAGAGFPALCRSVLGTADGCWQLADPGSCLRLFDVIADEAAEHGSGVVAADLIRALVRTMARSITASPVAHPAFIRACHLLDRDDPPPIAVVADRCGVSVVHLCRLFAHHAGCPPAAWARQRRLDRAAAALLSGDASVQAVAEGAGWDDPYAFARAFRRRFGATPRTWRAARRGGQG